MTMHVIFDAAARAQAESMEFNGGILLPTALANGTEWVTGLEVLTDQTYAEPPIVGDVPAGFATALDWLNSLPTREVDPSEFPTR